MKQNHGVTKSELAEELEILEEKVSFERTRVQRLNSVIDLQKKRIVYLEEIVRIAQTFFDERERIGDAFNQAAYNDAWRNFEVCFGNSSEGV